MTSSSGCTSSRRSGSPMPGRGRGGLDPLAPPRPRASVARRLHPDGREDGAAPAPHPLGAERCPARLAPMVRRGDQDPGGRQRLPEDPARSGPPQVVGDLLARWACRPDTRLELTENFLVADSGQLRHGPERPLQVGGLSTMTGISSLYSSGCRSRRSRSTASQPDIARRGLHDRPCNGGARGEPQPGRGRRAGSRHVRSGRDFGATKHRASTSPGRWSRRTSALAVASGDVRRAPRSLVCGRAGPPRNAPRRLESSRCPSRRERGCSRRCSRAREVGCRCPMCSMRSWALRRSSASC